MWIKHKVNRKCETKMEKCTIYRGEEQMKQEGIHNMETKNKADLITGIIAQDAVTTSGYVLRTACRDCNTTFGMTEDEIVWYRDHGYVLPKACPECRKVKRKDRLTQIKEQKRMERNKEAGK